MVGSVHKQFMVKRQGVQDEEVCRSLSVEISVGEPMAGGVKGMGKEYEHTEWSAKEGNFVGSE
jgi:hypothetical protein